MLTILLDNSQGSNSFTKKSPKIKFQLKNNKELNTSSTPKKDTSIINSEFYEYRFTRRVISSIIPRLQALGFDVINIIPETNDVSISNRIYRINKICKKQGNENCIMISVHTNNKGKAKWLNGRGWSAYAITDQNDSDKLVDCLYDMAEQYFNNDEELVESFNNTKYKSCKPVFTKKIDDSQEYDIIKKINCAGVLIKNFFMDNKDDVLYLESEDGFRKICDIIVNGIVDYATKYKGYKRNV